jgi:hypothetical protein
MKAVSFSAIIYFLFLLTQPCQDVFARPLESSTISTSITEPLETESGSDECSPFCICSCCSISVAYQPLVTASSIESSVQASRETTVEYSGVNAETFTGSIWQPPKF